MLFTRFVISTSGGYARLTLLFHNKKNLLMVEKNKKKCKKKLTPERKCAKRRKQQLVMGIALSLFDFFALCSVFVSSFIEKDMHFFLPYYYLSLRLFGFALFTIHFVCHFLCVLFSLLVFSIYYIYIFFFIFSIHLFSV